MLEKIIDDDKIWGVFYLVLIAPEFRGLANRVDLMWGRGINISEKMVKQNENDAFQGRNMSDDNKTSCVFLGPCLFFSGYRLKTKDKLRFYSELF